MSGHDEILGAVGNAAAPFPTPALSPGEREKTEPDAAVDLLILSDGTILVHNLTPALAAILNEMNPRDENIQPRALASSR